MSKDLYSVFVGHLPKLVTKVDLIDIFSGVGKVEDLFIVESRREGFNYGFIRFKEMESAVLAVKTLHRWPIRGTKLVVDLAKDTFERIQRGNFKLETLLNAKKEMPASGQSTATSNLINSGVKDIMYLSRVKEACISYDADAKLATGSAKDSDTRMLTPLDVDCLMDDICKSDRGRVSMMEGPLPDEASMEKIRENLLHGNEENMSLGSEKVRDFIAVLQDVWDTVDTFLKEHESEHQRKEEDEVDEKQLSETLPDDDKQRQAEQDRESMSQDTLLGNHMNGADALLGSQDYRDTVLLGSYEDRAGELSGNEVSGANQLSNSKEFRSDKLQSDEDVPDKCRTTDHEVVSNLGRVSLLAQHRRDSAEGRLSFSDEGDVGHSGDSGNESDSRNKSVTGESSFNQQDAKKMSPKCAEILSSPVVQSYLARASLGRGRGSSGATPPIPGYGRGIPVTPPTFNGYGRGFRY